MGAWQKTTSLLNTKNQFTSELNGANAMTAKYLRAGGRLVGSLDSASVMQYYLYNGHGDIAALANSQGGLKKSYTYDAFGNEVNPIAGDANPFRYAGEYFDKETGSIYLRARNYSPWLGRFTSEDTHWNPSNMIYGDGGGSMPNISTIRQSGNLYAYGMNNPVLYVNPNGEITILAGAIAAGIGGLVNAGINLGGQLIANGGDMSSVEWVSVGASFVSGAVATGLAVATVGASVVASGAISSTADYLMYNGLTGGDANMQGLAIAAVTGGATGGLGTKVGAMGKVAKNIKFPSAKGLSGIDFENFLTKNIGGSGSFKIGGREFDGRIGNRWWEAKSGGFWDRIQKYERERENFFSSMGHYKKIAGENRATFELFSNTRIPQEYKDFLMEKGIPFTEILN